MAKRILPEQLIPKIKIDALLAFENINNSFYKILKQLAPFGPKNMRPTFESREISDTGYSRIVGENHLKLSLKDKKGNRINGIAFRMADKLPLLEKGPVDICYQLDENHWNGKTTLEINVKDIKASF